MIYWPVSIRSSPNPIHNDNMKQIFNILTRSRNGWCFNYQFTLDTISRVRLDLALYKNETTTLAPFSRLLQIIKYSANILTKIILKKTEKISLFGANFCSHTYYVNSANILTETIKIQKMIVFGAICCCYAYYVKLGYLN